MKKIKVSSPAKINLFLKILNKRKDNYHNIETIFEKVSLFDTILIRETPGNSISISTNAKHLPLDGGNLCYKAADAIKKRFKIKTGVHIHIEKNIPIAAGLGGGSSNAASVLKGLNLLWRLKLGKKGLIDLSNDLGSDVALFISDSAFILGKSRGNEIVGLRRLKDVELWHVLICPQFEISTALAYSLYEGYKKAQKKKEIGVGRRSKLKLTMPCYDVNIINHALFSRDVFLLDSYTYNNFSSLIFSRFRRLKVLKENIEKISSRFVHLSGSGSTLFTVHSKRKEAGDLARDLEDKVDGCRLFVVKTFKN